MQMATSDWVVRASATGVSSPSHLANELTKPPLSVGGAATGGADEATDPCAVGPLVCAGGLLASVEFEVGDRKNGPITPTATTTADPKTPTAIARRISGRLRTGE
jgi:hypothetical protein